MEKAKVILFLVYFHGKSGFVPGREIHLTSRSLRPSFIAGSRPGFVKDWLVSYRPEIEYAGSICRTRNP
jgi:hypothetical protein